MRNLLGLLVFTLLLAACDATTRAVPSPSLQAAEEPGVRRAAISDDYWAKLPPAERRRAVQLMERVYAEQGDVYLQVQIAMVDNPLPGGARAIAIREAGRSNAGVLVLSLHSGDSDALALGSAALREDARRVPRPTHRRVLHLGQNSATEQHSGDVLHLEQPSVAGGAEIRGQGLLARLSQSATSITDTELPGIGRGKLLRFD
jgi:hypothetical protein